MNRDEIEREQALQLKGLNAPRLTPKDIDNVITMEQFYIFPNTTTTVCCLTLRNGFTVVGHGACASPENFDVEEGRKIAYKNAREQIWGLEGYLLKEMLNRMEGEE